MLSSWWRTSTHLVCIKSLWEARYFVRWERNRRRMLLDPPLLRCFWQFFVLFLFFPKSNCNLLLPSQTFGSPVLPSHSTMALSSPVGDTSGYPRRSLTSCHWACTFLLVCVSLPWRVASGRTQASLCSVSSPVKVGRRGSYFVGLLWPD